MALLAAGAITGAISLGMGAYKAYQGSEQEKAGQAALKNVKRSQYNIPDEVYKNLSESEAKALEGLPSEQKKEYVQNVERSQQNALQASAERKGGLLGIQASASQATDAFTNLTSMDAQARAENQQEVQRNRLVLAQEKQKQFDVKTGYEQQDLASAQGMIGAGQQNQMSGYDQMAASAIQAGGSFIQGKALQGAKDKDPNDSNPNTYGDYKSMGGSYSRKDWRKILK